MARTVNYPLVLDPERRARYEHAAQRNGVRHLSEWIRAVLDAAVERRDLAAGAGGAGAAALVPADQFGAHAQDDISVPDPCLHRVFRVEVLAWGGRRCGGCGELL